MGDVKTGTTAFQSFLKSDRAWLLDKGFHVPETGQTPVGAHHALMRHICGIPNSGKQAFDAAGLHEELENHRGRNLLISSELIQRLLRSRDLQSRIVSFFEAHGFDVSFLFYIRHPAEYANSAYSQMCKSLNQSASFPDYVSTGQVTERIAYWLDLAERTDLNLQMRPYNKAIQRNGVVEDILQVLGLPSDRVEIGTRKNSRPGPVQISLARWFLRTLETQGQKLSTRQRPVMGREIARIAYAHEADGAHYSGLTEAIRTRIDGDTKDLQDQIAATKWGRSWANCFPDGELSQKPCNDTDEIGLFDIDGSSWDLLQSEILDRWDAVKSDPDLRQSDPANNLETALRDVGIELPDYDFPSVSDQI